LRLISSLFIESTFTFRFRPELNPKNHVLFANRALSYILKEKWAEALNDANTATQLDPRYSKGWLQLLRCHLAFGDIQPANLAEKELRLLESDKSYPEFAKLDELIRANENLVKSVELEDFRAIVYYATCASKIATESVKLSLYKAEALAHMHRYEESNDLIIPLLRIHRTNADAHYTRGVLLYYQEFFDQAILQFQAAIRLDQDQAKAAKAWKVTRFLVETKEAGNQAYRAKKYDEALDKYLQCLKIDPNHKKYNSKLNYNIALVSSAMNDPQKAVDYCLKAIKLDADYLKAQIKLSQLYLELEKFEEAVRELETLFQKHRSREIRSMLDDAKTRLKRSKRKDWYKILGVDKDANEDQIKRAFKKGAVVHHPDKHQNDPPEDQKMHEMLMKDLNSAQATLLDREKRRRFDLGIDDSEGSVDPNDMLNSYFQRRSGHFSPFQHFVFE
jgi:DnaJ family protein C protein 7